MFGGKQISELTPDDLEKCQDDIAALALKEFQAQRQATTIERRTGTNTTDSGVLPPGWVASGGTAPAVGVGPGGLGGPVGGLPTEPYKSWQQPGISTEELRKQLEGENEEDRLVPMDPREYRLRLEKGLKLEVANAATKAPTQSFHELAEISSQIVKKQIEPLGASVGHEPREPTLTLDDILRFDALSALERSQMPAVAAESDGHLVKTIEHYTFADGDDTVSFYIYFDKDLWDGASKFISENQVKVESHATSLRIRLDGVPVSDRSLETLAEWRLNLSPLFSRVEPMMTTHKVRSGKLSVKLAKAKNTPWKKGVKYS